MAEPLRNPGKRRLENEVVPFSSRDMRWGSVALVDNPDPVLAYVAKKREEEYRTMERAEPAVSIAKTKRVNTLLSYGSEVQAGSSSKEAAELRDWSIQFLKRIARFGTVQRKCLDAIFWGWRPQEVLWDFDFKWQGKRWWGVKRIHEKYPEAFRFTIDRELVHVGNGMADPLVFNRWEDQFHWLVCTANSNDNPYGEAIYRAVWLIYYVKQRFLQLWAQGMGRSVGTLKMKQTANPISAFLGDSQAKSVQEIAEELRDVLKVLNDSGVLVERFGWALEMISDVRFSDAWRHPLEYCDELIRLIITGETLTSKISETGSRAAAEVHRSGLIDYCKADAKEIESWINDNLLQNAIRLNFGEDVPPEDMPRWRSKIGAIVDLDKAKVMWDMFAPLDGKKIAADAGVPIITEPGEDDLVLQKVDLKAQLLEQGLNPDGSDPNDPNAPSDGGEKKGPRRPVKMPDTPKQTPAAKKPDQASLF